MTCYAEGRKPTSASEIAEEIMYLGRRDEIRFQVTPIRSYQQKNLKFSATTMGTRQHSITKITDRRNVTPQVSVALKSL